MSLNNKPSEPTTKIVKCYLDLWKKLENYQLQEKSLRLLFKKLATDNSTIESILLKVSALNDFYSTNIYDTYSVAKHILSRNIDEKLTKENLDLVGIIATGHGVKNKKNTEINFYSFASKYCAHHKPRIYPIYDSYVDKMLWHFRKKYEFSIFKRLDLKNYRFFVQTIDNFSAYYKIGNFSRKEIDIYLWLAGKKYFPNKY